MLWWVVDDGGSCVCGGGGGGGGFFFFSISCGCHGGSGESGWLLWIFFWKFYFILISCLYYFNEMKIKIEPLMLDVL